MLITFIIAVGALVLFVLGLSITLMRKGRNIQGDVGENDDMKRMGLECTSASIRREEAELRGEKYDGKDGCSGTCASCEQDQKSC